LLILTIPEGYRHAAFRKLVGVSGSIFKIYNHTPPLFNHGISQKNQENIVPGIVSYVTAASGNRLSRRGVSMQCGSF
jgi:hypothetical protein